MINTDNLNSCIDLANGASADLHRTMLYTMQQMADRITQLLGRTYANNREGIAFVLQTHIMNV